MHQEQPQNESYSALMQAETCLKQFEDEKFLQYRERLARIRHVLRYCRESLERVDLQLVPITQLNNLQGHLTALHTHLDEFFKSSDEARLNSTDTNIDEILNILNHFPTLPNASANTFYGEVLKDYEDQTKKLLNLVKERTGKFEVDFRSLEESLGKKHQEVNERFDIKSKEIQQTISEKDAKFSEDLKRMGTEIDAQKARLDGLAGQFTEQFSKAQESRLNSFNNDLQQWKESFEAALKKGREESLADLQKIKEIGDDLTRKLEEQGEKVLTDLHKRNNESAKLLDVAGAIAFTGHHKKQADKEACTATVLQVVSFILLFSMLIYNLMPEQTITQFWQKIIGKSAVEQTIKNIDQNVVNVVHEEAAKKKTAQSTELELIFKHIILTLIFLIPAGYTAFESARHRQQEYRLRQFELEMAAVHPYFADIHESEEKEKKRIELADRFFGNNSDDKFQTWTPPTIKAVTTLLKTLGECAEKFSKKQ